MSAHRCLFAAVFAVALAVAGCTDPQPVDPYAAPNTTELDLRQEQVNARPDLETTKSVLAELDTKVRATIAKHAPQTELEEFGIAEAQQGCLGQYTWSIGQEYHSAKFSGQPTPDPEQWQRIVDELEPAFEKAGFGRGTDRVRDDATVANDDGAVVELRNGSGGAPLMYQVRTSCQLPAAWRTEAPPPSIRGGDQTMHYPYLFGDEGGRTRAPGG